MNEVIIRYDEKMEWNERKLIIRQKDDETC